jgi:hypothetical protein
VEIIDLQRGTAAAAELGGHRHLHQLQALCLIFGQSENIYCAMQLCGHCVGLIAEVSRQLRFDVT